MSVKINSFGGVIIWILRKYCSPITSKVALEYASRKYKKEVNEYIHYFLGEETAPIFKMVNIETVNRCNGTCAFCPANIHAEKREYKKMPQGLFEKIIVELKEIDWEGQLFLNINNEPFIDKYIVDRARFAKEMLGGKVTVSMFTNGTLLTIDKLEDLAGNVDKLIINNYSDRYRLNDKNRELYRHIKKHPELFKTMEITLNRRYTKEVLATRAGMAPNKPHKNNNVVAPCIYPFTDITIFPDGKVGLCCNDCYEVTDYGSLHEQSLVQIWRGKKFLEVREKIKDGRLNFTFCMECDVVDSGFREKLITNARRKRH